MRPTKFISEVSTPASKCYIKWYYNNRRKDSSFAKNWNDLQKRTQKGCTK